MVAISKDRPEDRDSIKPREEREITIKVVDNENLERYLTDPLLTHLRLSSPNIHDADFSVLESFPKLETLFIGKAAIQKSIIPLLSSIKNLKDLAFGMCEFLHPSVIDDISSVESLTKLRFWANGGMNGLDLGPLGDCRLLGDVFLANNGLRSIDLSFVETLQDLRILRLDM
ncbi:MAG: hypothetical protein ACFFFC_19810, partial [Candidatus Thorarchaeota archaeon]